MDAGEFAQALDRLAGRTPAPRDPASVLAATALVREGAIVSLGCPPPGPALARTGEGGADGPQPYALSRTTAAGQGWEAVNHRFEIDIHGATSMTHIDALDHFAWQGRTLDGGLESLAEGIVTRAVLIDVPRMLQHPVPPGQVLGLAEVRAALDASGTQARPGDALCFRFGRADPRSSHADLDADPAPGVSIECLDWLAELGPSLVVTDNGLDANPSEVTGIPVPWHVALLGALGIPLIDMADLERLSAACEARGRYEFALTVAPLPIPRSTGSPVNPLALF